MTLTKGGFTQNLLLNPRFATAANSATSRAARTQINTGGPLDSRGYINHTVNALGVFPRSIWTAVSWAIGDQKWVSCYARAAIGQNLAIGGQFGGSSAYTQSLTAATGVWQRIAVQITAPTGTNGTFQLWAGIADNAPLTTSFDLANAAINPDPILWPYADGDSPNWTWLGTAGASVSQGIVQVPSGTLVGSLPTILEGRA